MLKINKNPNKDFVILNLTDFNLDFGDFEKEERITLFRKTINELIERVKPDFITFSGDFSRSDLVDLYPIIKKVFEEINLPWTFVLGNHDNQDGYERSLKLATLMAEDKNCLFEAGDPEMGVGNFVIQIFENDKPIYALVLMDSHNMEEITLENGEKKMVWSRLNKKQLEWYKNTVLEMSLKTTLITHIPPFVYRTAFNKAFNQQLDKTKISFEDSFNENCWNEGYKSSFGVAHEDICSYPVDGGEFDYIKDSKYTELVLVGHDHVNNFVIEYEGIKLAYATKTGPGCYFERELNGGTVLTINKDGVKIRQELVK